MCILVKRLLSYGNEVFYTIIRTRYPRGEAFLASGSYFQSLPSSGTKRYPAFLRCHRFAPGVSATAHPSRCAALCSLVMEQSDSGKYHRHVILITAFDDRIIADGAAGLCNVFYAALMCAFDVIGKREECVRAKGYIGQPV